MSTHHRLPRLRTIDRSLRRATEAFAYACAEEPIDTESWNEFDWEIACAASALQGISSILSDTAAAQGPSRWQEFLATQREHCLHREQRIRELLDQIDAEARREDLCVLGLKGSALLQMGIYAPGRRPMGDIDLLVPKQQLQRCEQLLGALGYRPLFSTWRHHVYEPKEQRVAHYFGEHIDNPIKIEVHTRIAERLPASEVDITSQLWPEHPTPGLNDYRSTNALLQHLLLHAAGNIRARALRMIQLHDIATLLAHENVREFDASLQWWALSPLSLVGRYYAHRVSASALAQLGRSAPALLRRAARRQTVSDVSWSNVFIQAFPGIEWSNSFREAALFMRSRVFPNSTAIAELRNAAQSQPAIQIVPWYLQSHSKRILRWIFGSPPRVQTIQSVIAVLNGSNRT